MADLKELRTEIDKIDEKIRILFLKRMELVNDIAEYKMGLDMTVYDSTREAQVIEKNVSKIDHPLYKEYYHEVLNTIMKVSKDYQKYLILRSTL